MGKTLVHKLLLLLLGSVLCAALFFGVLHMGSNVALDYYFSHSNYLDRAEHSAIAELQEYITKQNLTPLDRKALNRWTRRQSVVYLEIYRDNQLLYASNNLNDEDVEYEKSMTQNSSYHSIHFSDGSADVFLLGFFDYQFYSYALIGEIMLSFAIFLLLFIPGIRKRIGYIQTLRGEIGIMEGGCLEHPVTIRGRDELAELAQGLEQLRESLKTNIEQETALQEANHNLITGIAHDLRTPLTALTMYVQILQSEVCTDEEKKKYYLEKIMGKAALMKELSDHLFECSQIDVEQSRDLTIPGCAAPGLAEPLASSESQTMEDTFADYLSELAVYLENQGFRIEASLDWPDTAISVRIDYIARIIDNISQNLVRYADPADPVTMATVYEAELVGIQIQNHVKDSASIEESAQIGMKNIQHMMQHMNGICRVEEQGTIYCIRLLFPFS